MPSSTSSSDSRWGAEAARRGAPAPASRSVPDAPWGRIAVLFLVLLLAGLGAWEGYWRSVGFEPAYRNSDGLWAIWRRAVDRADDRTTVIIGSSRAMFDINLDTWEQLTGRRPIQLALEGTNPRPVLKHLAEESAFAGLLVVGVTPPLFFTPGFGHRESVLEHYPTESPSQWLGQRISMLVEPYLAFYNFDAALFTVLKRQDFWPARAEFQPPPREVRRLGSMMIDRREKLWDRIETDAAYGALMREIWVDYLAARRELPPPEVIEAGFRALIAEVRGHVEAIRARGGEVVFIRLPSTGRFREIEGLGFPRATHWDVLLREVNAAGVHFEDHPELADVSVPEWSHVSDRDTDRLTRVFVAALREQLAARGTPRRELEP